MYRLMLCFSSFCLIRSQSLRFFILRLRFLSLRCSIIRLLIRFLWYRLRLHLRRLFRRIAA